MPLTIDAQYVVGFNWARPGRASRRQGLRRPPVSGPVCRWRAADHVRQFRRHQLPDRRQRHDRDRRRHARIRPVRRLERQLGPVVQRQQRAGHHRQGRRGSGLGPLRAVRHAALPRRPRVLRLARGTGKNYETTGEGIGGGMILPVVPKMLDFQVSGLIGQGVGRYGTAQLADATFSPTGKIEPLSEYSVMGGLVGHPVPAVDVYAYGGAEGARAQVLRGHVNAGYGNPNARLARLRGRTRLVQRNAPRTSSRAPIGAWWRVVQVHLRHRAGRRPVRVCRRGMRSRALARPRAARCRPRRTRTCSCSASATIRSSRRRGIRQSLDIAPVRETAPFYIGWRIASFPRMARHPRL